MVLKMMNLDHLGKNKQQTNNWPMLRAVPSVTVTRPNDGSRPSSSLTALYCSLISSTASKTQIIQQVLLFFLLTYFKTCFPTLGVATYMKISPSSLKKHLIFY